MTARETRSLRQWFLVIIQHNLGPGTLEGLSHGAVARTTYRSTTTLSLGTFNVINAILCLDIRELYHRSYSCSLAGVS